MTVTETHKKNVCYSGNPTLPRIWQWQLQDKNKFFFILKMKKILTLPIFFFKRSPQKHLLLGLSEEKTYRRQWLSAARQSKRAKISLSSCTSSWAVHWDDSCVNPHMSANTMLKHGNQQFYIHNPHVLYHLWPIIRVPRNIHVFSIFKTRRVSLSPVGVTLNEHLRCLTQHYHWNITIKAPTNTTLSGKYLVSWH